jgi:hypothetical protein
MLKSGGKKSQKNTKYLFIYLFWGDIFLEKKNSPTPTL